MNERVENLINLVKDLNDIKRNYHYWEFFFWFV